MTWCLFTTSSVMASVSTVLAVIDLFQRITRCHLFSREPSKWQVGDVEHLGRLVLSLPTKHINSIPLVRIRIYIIFICSQLKCSSMLFSSGQMVLNKDTVELVLLGQKQWEDSVVGRACVSQCMDQRLLRQQTRSLIRGIVNAPSRRARGPIIALCSPALSRCAPALCV